MYTFHNSRDTFFSIDHQRTSRRDRTIHQVSARRERSRLENYPDALIVSSGAEERRSGYGESDRGGRGAREDSEKDAW